MGGLENKKRQLWIVANWKSNETIKEALEWIDWVGPKLEKRENLKVVVCPTFVALEEVKKAVLVGSYPILVGAQDLSPFDVGPYTGEEAAQLLQGLVDLVLIGHWERRHYFGEDDEMVSHKAQMAQKYGLIPLVCVQEPDARIPLGVNLIAYEPVFAIGSGHPDTPGNAAMVAEELKRRGGGNLAVLYGGSVNAKNVTSFLKQPKLSGLLIGQASLNPLEFLKIAQLSFKFLKN